MTTLRARRPALLLLALLVSAAATFGGASAGLTAKARYRVRWKTLAPGVSFARILDRRGPNRVRLVRVDLDTAATVDVAVPGRTVTGFVKTSTIARRKHAVAAVNGTFTLGDGRPISIAATNGYLKTSPLTWGRAFAVSAGENRFFTGHPRLRIEAITGTSVRRIRDWNEPELRPGELAAFTRAGGSSYRPPSSGCSVRLHPEEDLTWGPRSGSVQRRYSVARVHCGQGRVARYNGVVLSARRPSRNAGFISSLPLGATVTVRWSVGWRRVLDVLGGNPVLLHGGRVVAPASCSSYFCGRNPRTGVGVTADGRVLLMTVDGRQDRRSVGMTLVGFARTMRRFGAVRALNLDGGGSTTMVVEGRVVNRPSDSDEERPVGSALLVLRSPDGSGPLQRSTGSGGAFGEVPGPAKIPVTGSTLDPGSTGGLLDALARGDLGRPRRLPKELRDLLGAFRASHRG